MEDLRKEIYSLELKSINLEKVIKTEKDTLIK
jgi:hypothetical protein